MKLWGGRFEKATDGMVDDFHSSISFDKRLYKQDIRGSIAHATMLGEQGIIPKEDADKIVEGLKGILADIDAGHVQFEVDAEDIHMNVEKLLTERIGAAGGRLHTGRSRNDQVALDAHMFVKDCIRQVQGELVALMKVLTRIAGENLHTIMPGYTHLQKAQPITLAHHMMAYFQMLRRDWQRLEDAYTRADVMPLGSGALAGTTYPLNRRRVADLLGFAEISMNSLDGVSDRDFVIEYVSDASLIMMHLSRFCEELILWSSNEFGFVEMDDAFSTGSSIMPQKKNPDVCELIGGKTGRVIWRPDRPALHDEEPAAGLQQGHAGGQGGAVRRARHGLQVPDGVHRDAGLREVQRGAHGARRGGRLYQRHRRGRLSGKEGPALPSGARGRGPTGAGLHTARQGAAGS